MNRKPKSTGSLFTKMNGLKRNDLHVPKKNDDEDVNVSIINIYGSGPEPIRRRRDDEDQSN